MKTRRTFFIFLVILPESLFTNIPIKEIIQYTLNKIYVDGSITILQKVYYQNITGKNNKRMRFTPKFWFNKVN